MCDRLDSAEILHRWRSWLTAADLSPHTIRLYSYGVLRFLSEVVGGHPEGATEEHVVEFLNRFPPRAPARAQYLRGLRSFFTFTSKRGYTPIEPTAGVKGRRPRRKPPVALTENELLRYFYAAAARSPRKAWALLLAFGTGMRRTELASVRPEDVQGSEIVIRNGKGGKERRLPLSPLARVAIEELRPWYNGTIVGGAKPSTVTEWAHDAAKDSGLGEKVKGRPLHILRSSFASHLLRKGVAMHVVRDLMGHEDLATTGIYAVAFDEDREAAVEQLV